MKPTAEPRCPAHPNREVNLSGYIFDGPTTWVCSICNRVLGVASVLPVMASTLALRWPQGRRLTSHQAAFQGIDVAFVGRLHRQGSKMKVSYEENGTMVVQGADPLGLNIQPSTTHKFWAPKSSWYSDKDDVYEMDCFVTPDGKVIPVPGGSFGYSGYAMEVGKDVFKTRAEALDKAVKKASEDVTQFKDWLNRAEKRLARLTRISEK